MKLIDGADWPHQHIITGLPGQQCTSDQHDPHLCLCGLLGGLPLCGLFFVFSKDKVLLYGS